MTVGHGAVRVLVLLGALGVLGVAALTWRLMRDGTVRVVEHVSVAEALGSVAADGFARALAPRAFSFPADHGPHPEFRNEWWYYTGNVATGSGRRFGYQLTFFRIALAPGGPARGSAWRASELWMAHLAVSDIGGRRFVASSRLARAALDLAGAQASPLRVWLEDWSAHGDAAGTPGPRMRLSAAERGTGIDLVLEPTKPPVLQGERGLSVKGPEPGQASYYYSLTRLVTRGTITVDGARHDVSGTSWMDREWSTSALGEDQIGWDWFAVQLDDGRDLMVYRLRRADGTVDPASAGTVVARDGSSRSLAADDVQIETLAWWSSPRDGARYPARWRVTVPREDMVLEVEPRLDDQEWTAPVRYWEGAVSVRGRAAGQPVSGDGYVELVGYAPRDRRASGGSAASAAPRALVR
jgi:predicted secreted hydrolase